MEIGSFSGYSIDPFSGGYFTNLYLFAAPLTFFLLINLAGALMGFLFNKIQMFQKISRGAIGFFLRIFLGFVIVAAGVWLHNHVFIVFGITWLVIVLGEVVWGNFAKEWHLLKIPAE